MDTCDVLIVGGGPAGSACAWKLAEAGLDVLVTDAATFPRDKVCAGWITPQVVADLNIDIDDYRNGRTFQPITGFRTGLIDAASAVTVEYRQPISFGIRRCEFDHYLLQRSRARLRLGTPTTRIRRDHDWWIVDESIRTPLLIGAGGHFCPVARVLNGPLPNASLVAAQEAELSLQSHEVRHCSIDPEKPELDFCGDLKGYGWCFRKQGYLNIGFGRVDRQSLPKKSAEFVAFLKRTGRIPSDAFWRWRGHAYLLSDPPRRRVIDAGLLLAGDAAGLAYPESGEGIRPAIESGLLAASTIVNAGGRYTLDRLAPYQDELLRRFCSKPLARAMSRAIPPVIAARVARSLFDMPWFVRHLVLDRWFLHAQTPAITALLPR
jgi:flavin-dependent dehydrogenase